MDMNTGKIIDFKFVHKGDLERQTCEQLFMDLTNIGVIEKSSYFSDKHKGNVHYPYT